MIRGRYAPSPSGPLHKGNLRTALLAWLQTRLCAGQFVLRMEDLDSARVKKGAAEQIMADLRWLGLDWDEGPDVGGPFAPYTQSQRLVHYERAVAELHRRQHLFACYCSRKDIQQAASAPHGIVPPYPGTCRTITRPTAMRASLRFSVADTTIYWHDRLAGSHCQQLALESGDFIVQRADKIFAYQLAVAVDDAHMRISDVVRGGDLLHTTARQITLMQALGNPVPDFWHVPLMMDAEGRRMAKRNRSTSLEVLKQQNYNPARIIGELAASVQLVEPGSCLSAQELRQSLDIQTFTQKIQPIIQASE